MEVRGGRELDYTFTRPGQELAATAIGSAAMNALSDVPGVELRAVVNDNAEFVPDTT